MNICIDIGNSLTKVSIFDNDKEVHFATYSIFDGAQFKSALNDFPGVVNGIVSSVKEDNPELYGVGGSSLKKFLVLNANTEIPVDNQYGTPQTLGNDRLAAVIGANYLYPGRNILVVDAGSAITFDFINNKGEYKGGNISPGLMMRFKALHEFTSKLPMLSPADEVPLLGRNTNEAIVAGVQNSIVFETDAYITSLNSEFPELVTIITGGDAKFFDNRLKNSIFVISNLVVVGLNRILNFNA